MLSHLLALLMKKLKNLYNKLYNNNKTIYFVENLGMTQIARLEVMLVE